MDFNLNWNTRLQKARQRLFFLKKLRYTKASKMIMKLTYSAYIRPVLTYHLSLFHGHLSKDILQRIKSIQKACKYITAAEDLPEVYREDEFKSLVYKLFLDEEHPFNTSTEQLPSGRIKAVKPRSKLGRQCFRRGFTHIINSEIFKR